MYNTLLYIYNKTYMILINFYEKKDNVDTFKFGLSILHLTIRC